MIAPSVLESLLFNRELDRNAMPSRDPIAGSYITSGFGGRADPFGGGHQFHKGIDFEADVGDPVLATSFLTVILGGLGSLQGAALAAFTVGLVEAFCSVYFGGSIGALILFVLVLLLLVFRPTGLLGRTVRGA